MHHAFSFPLRTAENLVPIQLNNFWLQSVPTLESRISRGNNAFTGQKSPVFGQESPQKTPSCDLQLRIVHETLWEKERSVVTTLFGLLTLLDHPVRHTVIPPETIAQYMKLFPGRQAYTIA